MKYCANCNTVYPADFQCCPKDGSALSSSSQLLPGMVIRDKYQILQQIGSGGMATVYQVRHLAFNEIKAIKLINSQLADGDQFNKRLRAEAVIARKLQHPNAVHVEDLDRTEDGRPFIVMEYVEGQNLRAIIRREGPLPTLRSLRIAAQVVSALAAAHKLGIVHRDIKPDNIHLIRLPDGSDFVKVLDFGIAKFTQGMSTVLTGSGLVVGTPQYVSPEQAMGKQAGDLDGRSDLYTLGVVLYEMLTGQVPFDSDTPVGLLVHHLHTTPIPPDEMRPDLGIPPSVSELLMKALQKNPEQRFRNADEMLSAITALEVQIQRVEETGVVEIEAPLIMLPEENPERRIRNADEMLSAINPVEQPLRFQGTGMVSMEASEKSQWPLFRKTDGMLGAAQSVEEKVKQVEETGTVMKAPGAGPDPHSCQADETIASVEQPVGRVEETGTVLLGAPGASPDSPSCQADETIASVEQPVGRVEETGTVLLGEPGASPDLPSCQADETIASVEQPVGKVEETGTVLEALEASPDPPSRQTDETPNSIASVEEPVRKVEETGTVMEALEASPDPPSCQADETPNVIQSAEEQVHTVEQPGTLLMKALSDGPDATEPPATDQITSGFDVAREDSPALYDATVKWTAPPDRPQHTMWPRETPTLRDTHEKTFPAAYKLPASRYIVYIGVAVFAVGCLAVLSFYKWRGTPARHSGQSVQELHDHGLPVPEKSIQPATQVGEELQTPTTQHSTTAAHSIPASDTGVTSSRGPAIVGEQEKLARIKDLVTQGRAISDSGDYTAAIAMFDSALKLDPQSSEAKAGKRRAKERMQLEQTLPAESK